MTHLAGSSRLLRAMNESAALSHLLERGGLTRAELRDLTGLSKPTVSEAVRRLTDAGLVVVSGHVSAGPGPNAEVYSANPRAAHAIAVSVRDPAVAGAPSLGAMVCDVAGTVLARAERSIDFAEADPVTEVVGVVRWLRAEVGEVGSTGYLQLGVAGSYDPATETIHHVEVPGWTRPGLVRLIREQVAVPVGVDNDVNLAAIAERRSGAAAGVEGFALLWLGDGLGLAIDLGGTLLRGARGGAGEIGYMPLYRVDGQRHAELQDLVGGQAVVDLAARFGVSGRTASEVVAAAAAGGPPAPLLDALAERIAVGLATVVAVLDPPLVVLGGEVARAGGPALRDAVIAAMRATPLLSTTIELSAVTDDPVLLGALAAALAEVHKSLIGSLRA